MSARHPKNSIAFRVDASLEMGTGHLIRCLTLAHQLDQAGWNCQFISRDLPGNLIAKVQDAGFTVFTLPPPQHAPQPAADDTPHAAWLGVSQTADAAETHPILKAMEPAWLVVDHYALDHRWERSVLPKDTRLFVIDDLADRPHDADVLLDQNYGRQQSDYARLVPSDCTLLIGPTYALLRPEFAARRAESLKRRQTGKLENLLVAMGGVDRENVTKAVLKSLEKSARKQISVTVVLGAKAPWVDDVTAYAAGMGIPTKVVRDVADIASLMIDADVAIGGAGTSTWERCCLGLPTIIVTMAENQQNAALALKSAGASIDLGTLQTCDFDRDIPESLKKLSTPANLLKMSRNCAKLVDGQGTSRCIEHFAL